MAKEILIVDGDRRARITVAGVDGTEMHAKYAPLYTVRNNLQVRVAGEARLVPFDVGERPAAHIPERPSALGTPLDHAGLPRDLFDDGRPGRLLEDDDIRRCCVDDGAQCRFAAHTAVPDVVGQQPQRHYVSDLSMSVRYG